VFSGVVSESLWTAVTTNAAYPLLNRDLNGLYPPGSTFKLITVGAGLEERAIDVNSTFRPCYGGFQFGTRFFRCWDNNGHGALSAVHAIEASCDVYMYQLGLKMGVDVLSKYMDACGFGKPTGIDLPGEAACLNPNSAYYNSRYGKNGWTKALTLNNAIGQGEILTTPLQLAQLYCGLANHGIVYRPHLVKSIRHPNGKVDQIIPEVSFKLPFSESTLGILTEGHRLVVEGKQGTARRLKNDLYSIGGKTGTAQNPHGNNHALFVGVAPLENPEIVCCAIVENAGHGSEVAAPVVGQIIRKYMEKKLGLNKVAQANLPGVQP
jgi:penicillin-binding protein 2